jgi:hypothetical protein
VGWRNLKSSGQTTSGPTLDTLRRKLTKGLEVRVEQPEARRGGDVRAVVVVTEPGDLGDLEVGLVCREFYDETVSTADSSSRETLDAVEYEAWQPMQCVRGEHGVTLTIPEQAPYSYAGDCLSFRWEVVARGRKRMALDAQASQEIAVRA